MNIKRSQLEGVIKQIVREVLQDKQYSEGAHGNNSQPSNNSSPTNAEVIVRLLIGKGIKDPERIKQLASQLHLRQFNKPIDLATLDQVIQKETGTDGGEDPRMFPGEEVDESTYKVQKRSYKTVNDMPNNPKNVQDPEVPVTETAYKVQGRSYKTFDDAPKGDTNYKDDPENT